MSLYNNELGRSTKIVSFVGMERCDLLLFLAKMATGEGRKILILDNSESQDLFSSVTYDNDVRCTDYRGITVVRKIRFNQKLFTDYDIVFVYHGMYVSDELLQMSDKVYIITSFEKNLTDRIATQLKSLPENKKCINVVMRDKVNNKISEKNILSDLCVPNNLIDNTYVIKFDMKDYAMYVSLTHNGTQAFRNMSVSYSDALFGMIIDILDLDRDSVDKKYIQRLIKRTR